MADNNPPPSERTQTDKEESGSSEKSKDLSSDQKTSEHEGAKSEADSAAHKSSVSRSQTLTEAEIDPNSSQPKEKKKKVEKPEIPIDFYYDIEEIRRRPEKSHDDLPDDFLVLVHSLGYPCQKRNNLHALSDNRLIFSAGCFLQILHLDTAPDYGYMYLPTMGGGSIGAINVHPSGKYFAVGEMGTSPNICLYDSANYRLYRILRNGTTRAFTSVCFNDSGDLLASQGGDPDHMLTVWNWRQETVLLRCKAFSQEVNQVSFNRELQGKLTTAGCGHVKFWTMARTFTGLKLQGQVGRFGRSPISDIEGLLEFPDGKVLTGSEWGNLLLWDEQLIKVQIGRKGGRMCHNGQVMHMMMVEGEIITAGLDGYVRSWNFELIDMLEAAEESALMEIEPMNEVLIGSQAQIYFLTQAPKPLRMMMDDITTGASMSLSMDENDTERHTWYCQDGAGGIWEADLSFRLAALAPKRLLSFHAGAIAACAVSPGTDLVMSLGEDGTLRLYDLLQRKLLAVKQFEVKGSSLVWIPGRVDNMLATVMAGFSDGGIRRVAIDGSTTTLFGVDHLECQLKLLQALRPHSATVTDLAFSNQDTGHSTPGGRLSSLATCSEDRTIFFFSIFTEDKYHPYCYVPLDHVPLHVVWSADQDTCDYLLVTCDGGIVIEMIQPRVVNTLETLEYCNIQMRAMKFISVKSEIQHEKELAAVREVEEKREKEKEEQNMELLEKGLETASHQALRIEAENAAMATERKSQDIDEPWTPYLPPTPSPILQTVYSEGGTFWLTLGEYDSGYFYECQFQQHFRMCDKENTVVPLDTKPVRAFPVLGGVDDVVTSICFTEEGFGAILGMKNGCIRLLILESSCDLSRQCKFWNQGVHDGICGAILGLKLSHNENFLITVGQDGNFFIFSFVPQDQIMADIKANIPAGAGIPEATVVDDLAPDSYTIEQSKQKSDYDKLVELAEIRKNGKRTQMADLRTRLKRLQTTNAGLPRRHRLTPDEFAMDSSLAREAEDNKMKKLEQLHKEIAWASEKAELGYRKLHDYYRKHVHTDLFCVRALATSHEIHSYRIENQQPRYSVRQQRGGNLRNDQLNDEDCTPADDEDEAELIRLLGSSINTMENLMGLSKRTGYLLKKVHEKRIVRAKRKITWKRFLNTKPADDLEDPRDLEAIQRAKDTIGDRPLKSDSSYVVPAHYRLTMVDGELRLRNCYLHLQRLQMDFNARLLSLREEKIQTITSIRQLIARLEDIHDRLDAIHYVVIPKCPSMTPDEQPGGEFHLDLDQESSLKSEVRERRRTRLEKQRRESRDQGSEFLRSRRRSSACIARENFMRRHSVAKDQHHDYMASTTPSMATIMDEGASISSVGVSSRVTPVRRLSMTEDQLFQSPLLQELREVEQINLRYEQTMLLKKIEEKTQLFDIHHRQLRHDKFELDVLVKTGHLRLSTLKEELLLLMECQHVEQEIQTKIDSSLDQKADLDKNFKNMQTQASKLAREIEENGKKDKALFAQLETIIGENNHFHDYLVKVYKKKVKRKPQKVSKSDASDSSESESESSDDDEESDEDDEDHIHMDLNMCPTNCNPEIYNKVVALRESRLDVDEAITEARKGRETLLKDMDGQGKKRQGIDASLNKAQKELSAFQLQKQQRLNALLVVVTINLHQIQCLRRNEFGTITDELILSEEELIRLQNRIGELHEEKKEEKKKTVERRRLHVCLKHDRKLFRENLERMEETCEKEMVKKFGQVVDLEMVETVVADPQVEDVRSRLLRAQQHSDNELRASNQHIAHLKSLNRHSLRLDSEYMRLEADFKARMLELERTLDGHKVAGKRGPMVEDGGEDEREGGAPMSRNLHDLMDLVAKQRQHIKDYLLEIQFLRGGSFTVE